MNENEPLEFAESSKKVAQKIDEEIDEIRTKIKKDFPARDITDLAFLEKLEKKSREAWMDYADSYAREKRKYSREKGLLKEKPYRDGIMIDPKKNNPYRDGIMIDPKKIIHIEMKFRKIEK